MRKVDVKQRGFTLIEMLAVVFVVGMMAGAATVFFSNSGADQELRKSIEKFVVISDHVAELAILSGEPIGLMLEPPLWRENPLDQGWKYSWKKENSITGEWEELEEVTAVEIDNAMELVVYIDENVWEYEDEKKIVSGERPPLVAFYPSGEVTPFEIEFSHDEFPGETETVLVDVWGRVIWKEQQEREQELEEDF